MNVNLQRATNPRSPAGGGFGRGEEAGFDSTRNLIAAQFTISFSDSYAQREMELVF